MLTALRSITEQPTPLLTAYVALASLLTLSLWLLPVSLWLRAARSHARLRHLAGASFEGVVIERNGIVLDANPRMGEMTGLPAGLLVGQPLNDLVPEGPSRGTRASDRVLRHRFGHLVPVELLTRSVDYRGRPATAIAVRDVSRGRGGDGVRSPHFDALTGLANQALLTERLGDALTAADRTSPVAVVRFALNNLDVANLAASSHDKLTVAVAERLGALVRGSDTLARLTEDEFAVMLPSPDGVPSIAISLASRIVSRLAQPFGIDGQHVIVGVSAGIAVFPDDGATSHELLRSAEIAMRSAKTGGFQLFQAPMEGGKHRALAVA